MFFNNNKTMPPIENTFNIDKIIDIKKTSSTAPVENKTRDEEMFKFYLDAQDAQYRKPKSK